jgi:hypothetical protein
MMGAPFRYSKGIRPIPQLWLILPASRVLLLVVVLRVLVVALRVPVVVSLPRCALSFYTCNKKAMYYYNK